MLSLFSYIVSVKKPGMTNKELLRIWKPIKFSDEWLECDTSILDDISDSWFAKREKLKENTEEYSDFLERLKREHAIETGVVERMYDLNKGITETLIKEGFVKSYLSHGDTNISQDQLIKHLNDHLEAVDFVFDVVKEDRPLTTSFINELHQLVTRNQETTEGIDQFKRKVSIPLLKGKYKERENNPTREDGTVVMYCPPEHVASEMDILIKIYHELMDRNLHPLIISAWFHHAFSTIHPFQDGNGRLARLLTSLIFIKFGFFPFTVLREEARVKYINALEKADMGEPQNLVSYFGEVQKRNIQRALNIKAVTSTSFEEVQSILVTKLRELKKQREVEHQQLLSKSRNLVFEICSKIIDELRDSLRGSLLDTAEIKVRSCSFESEKIWEETGTKYQDFFYHQIVGYAKKHDYYFNRALPKAWLTLRIELTDERVYQLGLSIHHYGYDDTTLAIGSFLEYKGPQVEEHEDTSLPLDIPPHVISIIANNINSKEKNIRLFIENSLTLTMAQIASEL